jgi:hypothetical protein
LKTHRYFKELSELFKDGQRFQQAAGCCRFSRFDHTEMYEQLDKYHEAGECYEKCLLLDKAATCYIQNFKHVIHRCLEEFDESRREKLFESAKQSIVKVE